MTSRQRARRSPWRWLPRLALLVVVLGLVAVVSVLRSDLFQDLATSRVQHVLEQQSGERARVEAVQVLLWPPAVEVQGLQLWHEATGDTIASADRIRAPLVLRAGRIQLGKLTLDRPVVQLHVEEDGKLRELRGRPDGQGEGGTAELPWSSLAVTDGTFRLFLPDGEVSVTGLDVAPVRGAVSDVRANLAVQWRDLVVEDELIVPAVRFGPDRIEIPRIDLDTRPLRLTGRARIPLQGDLEVDLVGRLVAEELNVLLEAPRAVHGTVDFDLRVDGPPADPRIETVILGSGLGLDVPGVRTPLLTYAFGDLVAAVEGSREGARVERAMIRWADGRALVSAAVSPDLQVTEGRLVAEDLSLAAALQATDAAPHPWVDFLGDAEIGFSGSLKPLDLSGPFELSVLDLRVGNAPVADPAVDWLLEIPWGQAHGRVRFTAAAAEIEADLVRAPRNRARASIRIGTAAKGPLDIFADVWDADLSTFAPLAGAELRGTGRVTGRIAGPFDRIRVNAGGDVKGFGTHGFPWADHLVTELWSDLKVLELRNARAEKGRSRYGGNVGLDFRDPFSLTTDIVLSEGRVEDVVGLFVDLPGLRGDLEGTLTLDGPFNDMDGEAHLVLGDVDLWGEHFPTGSARGFLDRGTFTLDDLRVTRAGGEAGVMLRGSVGREWKLDMELVGDGIRLERMDWLKPADVPLSGRVAFLSRVRNTLFEPEPDGRLAITDVRYAGYPVDDSTVWFDTRDGTLAWSGVLVGGTVTGDGTLGLWEEQPYRLAARFEEFPAHLFHPVAADERKVRAHVSGALALSGHFGETPSPVDLEADLERVAIRWGRHTLTNDAPWHYAQEGLRFALQDFSLSGGNSTFRMSATGGGPEGLTASGSGVVDIDLLRAVVPELTRAEGRADVRISVTGKAPDVVAVVDVDVDAPLVRHAAFPAAFEDVRGTVRATDEGYALSARSGLGGGTFAVDGRIAAQSWIPRRYDLRGVAEDAQLQWVDYLPPAIGDARLTFDGPTDALLLAGDVTIREMTFSDRMQWEEWVVEFRDELLVSPATVQEEPLFNLRVHIGAPGTIHLRNNVAEGRASADLTVIGDTARPGLVGRVQIEDALAFLQEREFRVERGVIDFRDPWTWDPELDFDLLTDITSRDRRYRVNYLVQGPFSSWTTAARSDPPLSQADVNALLWFGVTASDLEEMGQMGNAVLYGAVDLFLGDAAALRGGELEDVQALLFDIDVVSGVNARGEYSSDPRIVLEKRIGEVEVMGEWNVLRGQELYLQLDRKVSDAWSLSGWYATQQRDRALPIGGAYGVDLRARWERD